MNAKGMIKMGYSTQKWLDSRIRLLKRIRKHAMKRLKELGEDPVPFKECKLSAITLTIVWDLPTTKKLSKKEKSLDKEKTKWGNMILFSTRGIHVLNELKGLEYEIQAGDYYKWRKLLMPESKLKRYEV